MIKYVMELACLFSSNIRSFFLNCHIHLRYASLDEIKAARCNWLVSKPRSLFFALINTKLSQNVPKKISQAEVQSLTAV